MYPFRDGDASATFRNLVEREIALIKSLEHEYVLKASPAELERYYVDRVVIEPIDLSSDDLYIADQRGVEVDVSHDFRRAVFPGERAVVRGTGLDIAVPFTGDSNLWRLRPSRFGLSGYPHISIEDDEIRFTITFPDDSVDQEQLKRAIKEATDSLESAVENLRRDVESHNKSAPEAIRRALNYKREQAKSITGAIAGLGIPVKRSKSQPTFVVPTKRRKAPAQRPAVPTGTYAPEPILDQEEYEHILAVAQSMFLVIERNPLSFASLSEESIRDHFLLQLNGHYGGSATGETFNASGKTDILIRAGDRNVFIAECKFWRGSKAFDKAIDQLLGYLAWRDSKAALLIFNKTRNSSAVRGKMHEVMENRDERVKTVHHDMNGDSRYIFVRKSDPGREIMITTQLYDIPS